MQSKHITRQILCVAVWQATTFNHITKNYLANTKLELYSIIIPCDHVRLLYVTSKSPKYYIKPVSILILSLLIQSLTWWILLILDQFLVDFVAHIVNNQVTEIRVPHVKNHKSKVNKDQHLVNTGSLKELWIGPIGNLFNHLRIADAKNLHSFFQWL